MSCRPPRPRAPSFVLALALGLVGCAAEPEAAPAGPPSRLLGPPAVQAFDRPEWSGDPAAETVATVNGARVTLGMLQAQIEAHPDAPPRELLQRLVELEVLAQRARAEGFGAAPAAVDAWRGAMAAGYLEAVFEKRHTPAAIDDQMVAQIYKQVRELYDHADAWKMAHLAIACCDPKVDSCASAEAVQCFADAAFALQRVYEEVKPRLDPFSADPTAVAAAMRDYHTEALPRFPRVFFEEVSFYYDPDKPHAEQRGYNLIAESVARTVIDAPFGEVQPPVQSSFGWHVIVKVEHRPEQHRGPQDPGVAAEIRARAFPKMQRALYRRDVAGLHQQYSVRLDPAPLELLGQ